MRKVNNVVRRSLSRIDFSVIPIWEMIGVVRHGSRTHIQERAELRELMRNVEESNGQVITVGPVSTPPCLLWQWLIGAVLVLLIGSWLVWLSAFVQRNFAEADIKAACQRVMPDTVQRCVDTVVIQRGGARR